MKESEIVRRDDSLQQRRTHKFARGDTFTSLNKWVTFFYLFYRWFFLINIRVQISLRASHTTI
jgi:hypothetical protein